MSNQVWNKSHFGDPCIHCGVGHDDFEPGPCDGDFSKKRPIGYVSMGVRWDGVQRFLVRYSDRSIEEIYSHVSNRLPYYHFGHSDELISPPRYDEKIIRDWQSPSQPHNTKQPEE